MFDEVSERSMASDGISSWRAANAISLSELEVGNRLDVRKVSTLLPLHLLPPRVLVGMETGVFHKVDR